MTGPDGFYRKPLNPCEPIQAAQARRMVHQLRMTRAEIIAAGDALSPDDEYAAAQAMLANAIRRRMIAAHKKEV